MRIEKQPFVRHYFFGDPQYPAFVPWNVYFKCEKFLLDIPEGKLIKFHNELEHVKGFVLQDKSNILIVHAPDGYGKSHLLREIAKNIHPADRERQCWLVRPALRDIKDALQDEIISGRKYLLVLDDADRYLEDSKDLIAFAKSQSTSTKVILGTRTAGLGLIRQIIGNLRIEEFVEEMPISKWSKEELIQLLRASVNKEKIDDEDLIVTLYPNPFILVWIGRHIKGEKIDIHRIRKKMVGNLEQDVEKALGISLTKGMVNELLLNLSCIVPCPKDDPQIIEILGKHLGLEDRKLKEYINRLLEVKILREIGKSTRFNPDMAGDLYLASKLETLSETELSGLIERWMGICPEKILINLASASKYGDLKYVQSLLGKLVRSWINEVDKTPNNIRTKRLSLISEITFFVPEETLDLIYSYLNTKASPSDDPIIKAFNVDIEPDLDDYAPVIKDLMNIPGFHRKIASLIKDLAKSSLKAKYDNYKPIGLIRDLVSPIHRNPNFIKEVFEELSSWLTDLNIGIIEGELIVEAISEVLAGSHEYSRSLIGKFEFGERILKDSPVVHKPRDTALDLLKQLLLHSKLEIQLLGIKGVKNIGETRMGRISGKDLPLAQRIAKDRKEMIGVIGKLIRPDADFSLLNEIENLLITRWAQDISGTQKATELLRIFPRSPEYIIYRYFVSPDYVIEDFIDVEKRAPKGDKWVWFVDNFMHKGLGLKPEKLNSLVEKLNKKYRSPKEITNLVIFLDSKIAPRNPWAHPPFITGWAQMNPKVFLSIRKDNKLWQQIPERFKREIEIAISKFDTRHINKVAKEVLSELPKVNSNKVNTFLQLVPVWQEDSTITNWKVRMICICPWVSIFMPQYRVLSWLTTLIKKGTSEIRSAVVYNLYFLFEKSKDIETLLKLLNIIVKLEKKLTPSMIHNLSFLIHWIKKWPTAKSKSVQEFRTALLSLLKDVPFIDYHVKDLLYFCCDDIDSIIDFIDYRINKSIQVRKSGSGRRKFEAIPFNGIECLGKKISDYKDFEKLMGKVIYWYKQDSLLRFDLEYLMETLPPTHKYIEEQLNIRNIEHALIVSRFLKFSSATYSLFLKILQRALDSGLFEEAKSIFASVVYSGGWSAKLGELPQALVSKKEILEKMHKDAESGPVKSFIQECILSVDRQIKDHIKEDEEFLQPRG
ncbi:MAG: hypothetical protein Q7J55_03975 [bacterium]|nr:hypothetical protein [bacterium]